MSDICTLQHLARFFFVQKELTKRKNVYRNGSSFVISIIGINQNMYGFHELFLTYYR